MIWDQGFSVTPNTASIAGGGSSLEALSKFLLGFAFINLSWMTELFGEEWNIISSWWVDNRCSGGILPEASSNWASFFGSESTDASISGSVWGISGSEWEAASWS